MMRTGRAGGPRGPAWPGRRHASISQRGAIRGAEPHVHTAVMDGGATNPPEHRAAKGESERRTSPLGAHLSAK